jgi:hypothetical protein
MRLYTAQTLQKQFFGFVINKDDGYVEQGVIIYFKISFNLGLFYALQNYLCQLIP